MNHQKDDGTHHKGILKELFEPIAGPEELPDKARNRHPIKLTSFVLVMVAVEFFDLLLTQRLHFAIQPNSTVGEVTKAISISGNILFAVVLIFALGTLFLSRQKTPRVALWIMVFYLSVATVNVLINVFTLVVTQEISHQSQNDLVLDLGLVFTSITLIFSLWYQIADIHLPGGALDFPPNGANPDEPPKWFDYFCVSFFTNSTFGPTLEQVRSRPAKAIMMFQTALSLTILVVVVARIIKAP
jgi:hypothetical protein